MAVVSKLGPMESRNTTVIESMNQYGSCRDWLRSLRSPFTHKTYPFHLNSWLKFLRAENGRPVTPDVVVKMRQSEIRSLVFKYVFHLIDVAKPHAGKPVKNEISINSISNYLLGIKSWLDYNEIPTPYWKKLKKMLPEKVRNNFRAYTVEEVQKMMYHGDVFDRTSILLFVAGGERVGAQEGLSFKNIIELKLPEGMTLPDGWKMGMLDVYSDSEKSHYIVPLNPEAMHQIEEMKKYRKAHGERITPDSALIRDKFVPLSSKTNRPKSVKRGTIRLRMKKLQKLAGLPLEELQPDHSFRYFFNTVVMNSECKWEIKELMMGHTVRLDKFYYDKKSDQSRMKLVLEYMKAMDSLTILPEYRLTAKIGQYEERIKEAEGIKEDVRVLKTMLRQEQLAKSVMEADFQKKLDDQTANIQELMRPQVEKILLGVLSELGPLGENDLIQGFLGAVQQRQGKDLVRSDDQ